VIVGIQGGFEASGSDKKRVKWESDRLQICSCKWATSLYNEVWAHHNHPINVHIDWVVAVGPYFIIKGCGPFARLDISPAKRSGPGMRKTVRQAVGAVTRLIRESAEIETANART
jgi:hypothetical protein